MIEINAPLVTVYVTNYNYGHYIEIAIESVLSQSMRDFELIIIDDGSTDDSVDIITRYEGRPNVRIIFQKNKGLNRTANIALHAARGKYIMRLDADDYLDPQALLVLTKVLEDDVSLGLVFPDYYYVDVQGNVIGQERRHNFDAEVSLLDQPAHGACTMIRKQCLQSIGGYSEDFKCQDGYDLWLRFIEKWEVINVNLPLFYYRKHGENLTRNDELIITTRAEIKKAHARRTSKPSCPTLAVIPVRGRSVDPGCLALEKLGGKALVDWTVDAALEAEQIDGVVLTSPDTAVLEHGRERYEGKVTVLQRPLEMARENTGLGATLRFVREKLRTDFDPRALMVLSSETPFRGSMYLDKAIHTMRIFDVDSVIAILPEDDLFFRHEGGGLIPLGNSAREDCIRLEREYLYRKLPGLNLVSTDYFKSAGMEMGGRIGHVVYTRRAGFSVRNALDLSMAKVIIEQAGN